MHRGPLRAATAKRPSTRIDPPMTPVRSTPSGTPEPASLGRRRTDSLLARFRECVAEAGRLPGEERLWVLAIVRGEVDREMQR